MALPDPGPYQISQPKENLLTLLDNLVEGPVNIMNPTGNPGEQEWTLERRSGDSITLKNLKYHLFAGVKGGPGVGVPVVGVPEPFEFKLKAVDIPSHYHIYVDGPDGPLYVDYAPIFIEPAQAALSPDAGKPWLFRFME